MNSTRSTVLITGASSGIGKAAALLFQKRGWNVVATLRSPEKAHDLHGLERLVCVQLDVTEPASIGAAITQAIEKFGAIDVVVNNAGYALMGPFEACDLNQIRRQFETNVFGLMAVSQAVLPHFRARKSGTLINISSIGGRLTFPLYSLYHSTKWAVEGFSESLHYELAPLNIRVKLIEPGAIKTDFYERSADRNLKLDPDYQGFYDRVMPKMDQAGSTGSPPEAVAEVIFKAATDKGDRLRYSAGKSSGLLLTLRKLLPEPWFYQLVRQILIR
jgi:NAD(P)-dependent dehydrogenase (short-subunit alcohol dehydrogenase family)